MSKRSSCEVDSWALGRRCQTGERDNRSSALTRVFASASIAFDGLATGLERKLPLRRVCGIVKRTIGGCWVYGVWMLPGAFRGRHWRDGSSNRRPAVGLLRSNLFSSSPSSCNSTTFCRLSFRFDTKADDEADTTSVSPIHNNQSQQPTRLFYHPTQTHDFVIQTWGI